MSSRTLLPFPAGYSPPAQRQSFGPVFMLTASPTNPSSLPQQSQSSLGSQTFPPASRAMSTPRSVVSNPPTRPLPPSGPINMAGIGSASVRPSQVPPPNVPVPPVPRGMEGSPKTHLPSGQPHNQRSPHPPPPPPPPSFPLPQPVVLPELLAAHGQSPTAALNSLVSAYNSLAAHSSVAGSPASSAAKTASENTKLWNWCSSLKSQLAAASRDNRALHARVVELESMLRRLGHPLPPPQNPPVSSVSSSSLDVDGNPKRPEVWRSWSDGIRERERERGRRTGSGDSRSSTSGKRMPASSEGPPGFGDDSGDSSPLGRPIPLASSPISPVNASETNTPSGLSRTLGMPRVNEPPSPLPMPGQSMDVPQPSRLTVSRQHSLRKASSLDLGKPPSPLPTPVRSATPPPAPVSTSPPITLSANSLENPEDVISRMRTASGEMASLPDEARRYILASMGGGGGDDLSQLAPAPHSILPAVSPMSPLFLQSVSIIIIFRLWPIHDSNGRLKCSASVTISWTGGGSIRAGSCGGDGKGAITDDKARRLTCQFLDGPEQQFRVFACDRRIFVGKVATKPEHSCAAARTVFSGHRFLFVVAFEREHTAVSVRYGIVDDDTNAVYGSRAATSSPRTGLASVHDDPGAQLRDQTDRSQPRGDIVHHLGHL
jgi:hypothetical protein